MHGFVPLASGSKGNSILFGTKKTKILIDVGISCRSIQEKLAAVDTDIADIQGLLISHEHMDHIQGVKTLAMKYKIPVLANAETAKGIYAALHECPKFKIFTTGETFTFGDIEIHPFSVQHDTVDPVAFTLRVDNVKVGICTDLGFATTLVKTHLQECDYLVVESNHEENMVYACSRPLSYKQRVLSRSGHLSNKDCGALLKDVLHAKLKHVHLAHLSQECNSPQKALQVVREKIGDALPLSIAHQDTVSKAVYF